MLRFIVAQNQCAIVTIFHRRGLPNAAPGASNLAFRLILIDSPAIQSVQPHTAPTGLEIVTWKPCYLAELLWLWPTILEERKQQQANQMPVLCTGPSLGECTADLLEDAVVELSHAQDKLRSIHDRKKK
jgi:hypothetical protein